VLWWRDSGGYRGLGGWKAIATHFEGWNIVLNVVCAALYVIAGICGVTFQFVTFLPPHTKRNIVRWRLESRFVVRGPAWYSLPTTGPVAVGVDHPPALPRLPFKAPSLPTHPLSLSSPLRSPLQPPIVGHIATAAGYPL
jgi:hypothetical protein